ncbi:hypothetical protein [Cupriavidus necator]|uniref:hypothetical protein n=1 Tax=Cupriavidus necator TaxID=106590 RepID=UPI00339D2FC9
MKAKLQNLKSIATRAAAGAVALVGAGIAHAQTAPSMDQLTGQVSFADVLVGVFAIGGLLAALYASIKGVRIVLGMIRGR